MTPFISDIAYAEGYVFFVRSGTLMAQRLDPAKNFPPDRKPHNHCRSDRRGVR